MAQSKESAEIYERLAEQIPETFGDDFRAISLSLAAVLEFLGHTDEAAHLRNTFNDTTP